MRFNHLLLGLAIIFATIIAVEGLSPSASPTASPQAVESPAKKQPAKKKGWWLFGSTARATPAKASATPSSSPVVEVGKQTKKRKETAAETATPIVVTASSPHETTGSRAALTPAPGGGKGLVWVNTASHVYHTQKSRWYGKTKEGKYMTEEEAKEDGNRPARSSE